MTTSTGFDQWMTQVNQHLVAMCGMSSEDLPNCCYFDWYDDDVSPKSAARRAIRWAKEG
jgi:hypothetical protein